MDIVERIEKLINSSGKSIHRVTVECGLPHTAIAAWKSGRAVPSAGAIIKLAKYFNVSTDYLLGLDNNETKNTNTITNNNQSNATGGHSTNNINLGNLSTNPLPNNKIIEELPEFKDMWAAVKDIAEAAPEANRKTIMHNEFLRLLGVYSEVATGKKKKKKK